MTSPKESLGSRSHVPGFSNFHVHVYHLQMLLKGLGGVWNFVFPTSFQIMPLMLLSGLQLSSESLLKAQALDSGSGVIIPIESQIHRFWTMWIWTNYLISYSLFSCPWNRIVKKVGGLLRWIVMENKWVKTC